jgi:hypothetical protein
MSFLVPYVPYAVGSIVAIVMIVGCSFPFEDED